MSRQRLRGCAVLSSTAGNLTRHLSFDAGAAAAEGQSCGSRAGTVLKVSKRSTFRQPSQPTGGLGLWRLPIGSPERVPIRSNTIVTGGGTVRQIVLPGWLSAGGRIFRLFVQGAGITDVTFRGVHLDAGADVLLLDCMCNDPIVTIQTTRFLASNVVRSA